MNDLMIDLETLSTRNDAAILSIGACLFDIETGEIGPTFHRHIELDDSPLRGHISADTFKWWLKQDDAARQAIANPSDAFRLGSAISDFYEFIETNTNSNIWSNGANFDIVIIRSALDRYGYSTPWKYYRERDTRTLVDIAERITGINSKKAFPFDGIKHDALYDAIHQAKYISRAFNLIKTHTLTTL